MTESGRNSVPSNSAPPDPGPPDLVPRASLIDRRIRKITNARSVTVGLALTFLLLALIGAVVIRVLDKHDFPTLGLALWWSLQTVTTVGYGDIVPTTAVGRVVGGAELVLAVSFIAFLTAGVTSTVIEGSRAKADAARLAHGAQHEREVIEALAETQVALAGIDSRLDAIEAKLSG